MEATPTYAGIDWSWQHHAVCIVDDEGRRIEEVTVRALEGWPGEDRLAAQPPSGLPGRDRAR